jgi:branched-chain amino acid transport system substrate-binding protein
MTRAQMKQYDAFFPAGIYFTGESYYARSALKPGPVKTVVEAFYKAANEAGLPIEESQANAWDGTMLVIDAPRHLGANATAVQMREYIAGITNYAGINGMYDFKRNPRRGIGDRDGYVMHWDSAKHDLVILSSRGGVRR